MKGISLIVIITLCVGMMSAGLVFAGDLNANGEMRGMPKAGLPRTIMI